MKKNPQHTQRKRMYNGLYVYHLMVVVGLMTLQLQACSRGTNSSNDDIVYQQGKDNVSFTNYAGNDDEINDREISNAISWELTVQDGVTINFIDVETNEGIVTLSGTAENILAKDRATEIAQMVRGVKGVVNQIKVEDAHISDDKIRKNIKNALLMDPATELYEIDVAVDNGVVDITGQVESWQEKQLTARVVKSVAGVEAIRNKVMVDYTRNRPDDEILHEVEQIMHWDARVDDGLINVTVKNGDVTLEGIVGSADELNVAKTDAWVAGVKSVETDGLEVAKWARDESLRANKYITKADGDIEEAIHDAFLYDPRVFSFDLDASVQAGEVTLTGLVDHLKAKKAAEMDAKNVIGVWKVNNFIKVRSDKRLPDSTIVNRVESALRRNPNVNKYEIGVNVSRGKVYLHGYVDSNYEKSQAARTASGVRGVVDIENNLTVEDNAVPYVYNFHYGYYEPMPSVRNYTAVTDREIEKDIERQLWWSPFVNQNDVKVAVDNGVATLSGTVESWREYQSAEKNAYEGGATDVENKLAVTSG